MSNKPSIPKGTRDFSPIEMVRRNYIFDTIKKSFKKYGFQQIETPAMENLETLVGTGGEESDKLIFKILNSGDFLNKEFADISEIFADPFENSIPQRFIVKKSDEDELIDTKKMSKELIHLITEKALHYDLTVPFARYVVQNQNDMTFPFRRFQIQPVWRADRPQKGRYREFYQCDADIIGSDSLLNEVDLIKMIDDVFTDLFQEKLSYTISINNRKILHGIIESVDELDKFEQIMVAIDKYDKVGYNGVVKELKALNISPKAVNDLCEILINKDLYGNDSQNDFEYYYPLLLEKLKNLYDRISPRGKEGIEELRFIFDKINKLGIKSARLKYDTTLARGLGYYTGTIIEVKVDDFPSITGGGRYDDLTGNFGLKNVSGVGISFGADRIYDVLLDNNLYPEFKGDSTLVLFTRQSEEDEQRFLPLLFQLRDKGINAELYTEKTKWQKQMVFAEKKGIKFIVSANENGETFVKSVDSGEKKPFNFVEEVITFIQHS